MAAAQKAWNIKMRSILRKMEAVVVQVAGISLHPPFLHTQVPLLDNLDLHRVFSTLLRFDTEALASRSEYALFVTDFTSLLSCLVPQLVRFGSQLNTPEAQSSGTYAAEHDLFWALWHYLFTACLAFSSATKMGHVVWHVEQQPFYPPLYAAFHNLLVWILDMSRSPAWLLMEQQHGLCGRNHELFVILKQPIKCLVNLSVGASRPNNNSHLKKLSPAFLPLLCCIISEHFVCIPYIFPRTQSDESIKAMNHRQGWFTKVPLDQIMHTLLDLLTQSICSLNSFAESVDHVEYPQCVAFLKAPAVIQFLKALFIHTAGNSSNQILKERVLSLLLGLFNRHSMQAWNEGLLSACDSKSNVDAAGLPLHLNPLLSKPALETDVMLLHALSIHLNGNSPRAHDFHNIQTDILQSWMLACMRCPLPPAEAVAVIARSVIRLAKHCTALALQRMRQLTEIRVGCHLKLRARDVKRQQAQELRVAGSDSAGLGESELQTRNNHRCAFLASIRGLVNIVSCFCTEFASGALHLNTGE